MAKIMHRGFAIKTECEYCGAELQFEWKEMKYLTDKDAECQWTPQFRKIRYIECPSCREKVFVRHDDSGWMRGTVRIYEDTSKEVQDGRTND